ncbi:hypothetical protein [Bradyrhizobium sp. CW1]|uniref:hypothetical protein n=1 Tax=Bradyrhizobium sp. CW1 TaxID=2782686 RepID=UPI001FFEA643|nr:hypothetical protein [Bradyrhizobium sp. CW1]UPJ31019.1 hypothetical protein IVB54_19440 [Bradyrhizobium sp. CW1]
MFKQPVVFVVGAGASVDFGFPLGATLASNIAEDVNFYFDHYKSSEPTRGDQSLYWLLRQKFQNDADKLNRYMQGGQLLASALTTAVSIDDALYRLDQWPEIVELGKACILKNLLKCEAGSELRLDPRTGRTSPDAGKNGWIEQMFLMAISNLRRSEFREAFRNVTFVNFNYDRCIEHYVLGALQRQGLTEEDAAEIVGELNMIRPYGSLGSIVRGGKDYLPFGHRVTDVFSLTQRIRTYTESAALHDPDHVERVMAQATMTIFLGFGFHRQNMDLLRVSPERGFRNAHALATVYDVHEGNLHALKDELRGALRIESGIELYPLKAPDMLRKLALRISMAVG